MAALPLAWLFRRGPAPTPADRPQAALGLGLGTLAVGTLAAMAMDLFVAREVRWLRGDLGFLPILAAIAGYIVWTVRFLRRRFPGPAPAWDRPLKMALLVIGIILAGLSLAGLGLVNLAVCYSGCGVVRSAIPFLMLAVPFGYLAACLAWLKARARRAQADPAWLEKAARGGGLAANVATAAVLALLALVSSCFGLVFLPR